VEFFHPQEDDPDILFDDDWDAPDLPETWSSRSAG
jgi:hypothetical protein